MIHLKRLQKRIWKNKIEKGFNITDVDREFNFLYSELSEAFQAYRKKSPDMGEELADVAIFLLGLAEMLKVDLGREIESKMKKNKKRIYRVIKGVTTRIKG
jgi:NTP pyrophosphatase (non-canonical NTP hydrolase)